MNKRAAEAQVQNQITVSSFTPCTSEYTTHICTAFKGYIFHWSMIGRYHKGFDHRIPLPQSIPATWQAHRKEWLPEPSQTFRRCAATGACHVACGRMDSWGGIVLTLIAKILNQCCFWVNHFIFKNHCYSKVASSQ